MAPTSAGEHRRRSPRYPIDVFVSINSGPMLHGGPVASWIFSEHGATVHLQDLEPGESFRERIELEISSQPQDPIGVVLRGLIRRRSLQPDGLVIGVEFTPNDTGCIDLLRLLPRLRSTCGDVESTAHDLGFELEALTVDDVHVWTWRQGTDSRDLRSSARKPPRGGWISAWKPDPCSNRHTAQHGHRTLPERGRPTSSLSPERSVTRCTPHYIP